MISALQYYQQQAKVIPYLSSITELFMRKPILSSLVLLTLTMSLFNYGCSNHKKAQPIFLLV